MISERLPPIDQDQTARIRRLEARVDLLERAIDGMRKDYEKPAGKWRDRFPEKKDDGDA